MSLDIRDERMLELVDRSASRETLSEQFDFTEGPIWHPTEHHLTFSDIPANKLYRWQERVGISVFRSPSNMANGNTYDRQGRMLSCEHATSRVVRDDDAHVVREDGAHVVREDGAHVVREGAQLTVLASHYQGKSLNSPNDIVVRADGTIYFTDPTYGRHAPHGVERELELDFCGVFSIDPDGELHLLTREFNMPNGLCLSLDEQTLYVADTAERHIRKFRIDDQTLTGGEVFCDSPAPDGLKIDSRGFVYAGGPHGVGVYHRDDGTWLGNFTTPAFCANFAWGGPDLKTLFMTASQGLYRIPVKVPGLALC